MKRFPTILALSLIVLIAWAAAHIIRSLQGVNCLAERVACEYRWEEGRRVRICMEYNNE